MKNNIHSHQVWSVAVKLGFSPGWSVWCLMWPLVTHHSDSTLNQALNKRIFLTGLVSSSSQWFSLFSMPTLAQHNSRSHNCATFYQQNKKCVVHQAAGTRVLFIGKWTLSDLYCRLRSFVATSSLTRVTAVWCPNPLLKEDTDSSSSVWFLAPPCMVNGGQT